MKISKKDIKALLDAIDDARCSHNSDYKSEDLKDLIARVTEPEGPFYLVKEYDHRGTKVWRLDSDEGLEQPEEFERWFYTKPEALAARARMNTLEASGMRVPMLEGQRIRYERLRKGQAARTQQMSISPLVVHPTMSPEDAAEEDEITKKVLRDE